MSSSPADPTSTQGLPVVRGVPLQSVRTGGGFFDSLGRGWKFISSAYALAFQDRSLLLPTAFGMVARLFFAVAFAACVFLWFQASGGSVADVQGWTDAHRQGLAVSGVLWLFGTAIISYFFMGMTVSIVDAYLKGRPSDIGVAFRDAVKNLGAIAALALVDTVVNVLVSALKGKRGREDGGGQDLGGALLSMVGSLIQSAWTVLSFLLLPTILIEDVGLGTSLKRVRDIHRRNLLQIGVGEVGIRAIGAFAWVALIIVLAVLAPVLLKLGGTGVALLFGLFFLLAAFLGVLNSFARGAYYTCLYLWAVGLEAAETGRSAAPVLVPAPLAAALA